MRNATDQESKSKTFDIQTTRCINSYSLYYFPAISYDLEVVQCSHKEDPLNFFFDFFRFRRVCARQDLKLLTAALFGTPHTPFKHLQVVRIQVLLTRILQINPPNILLWWIEFLTFQDFVSCSSVLKNRKIYPRFDCWTVTLSWVWTQ